MADLADEASSLIRTLGLTKYVLVGHSMGGKVAQLLASRNPVGLVGLILVAPATPTPTHFPEEALQQQLHAYDNRETVVQTMRFLSAKTSSPEMLEQIVEDSLWDHPLPSSRGRRWASWKTSRLRFPRLPFQLSFSRASTTIWTPSNSIAAKSFRGSQVHSWK